MKRFCIFFVAFIALASIHRCDGRIKLPQLIIPEDDNVEPPSVNFETPFEAFFNLFEEKQQTVIAFFESL